MRRPPASFDATISAFRDMTALSAAGAATRARVLEKAGRDARWRVFSRRAALTLGLLLAVSSTAAALNVTGFRWHAPPLVRIDLPEAVPVHAAVGRRPTRVVPAIAVDLRLSQQSEHDDGERRAYEKAHRAHFFADAPEPALVAWDQYLAAFPRGTFAPEARYNRALCLVRLGRLAAAAHALDAFVAARPASYRQHEACLLIRWLSENGAPSRAESACAGSN
jgi:hypothetical protein